MEQNTTTTVKPMDKADLDRLAALETTITTALGTFRQVGEALKEIRDSRLYRAEFPSFEKYCQEKWDFSRVRAHQLVKAVEVIAKLTTVNVPTTETQARELLQVPEQYLDDVMNMAVTLAEREKKPLAARHIVKAREQVTGQGQDAAADGQDAEKEEGQDTAAAKAATPAAPAVELTNRERLTKMFEDFQTLKDVEAMGEFIKAAQAHLQTVKMARALNPQPDTVQVVIPAGVAALVDAGA